VNILDGCVQLQGQDHSKCFKISVHVYLDYILRTAEPFVIKLGMVVHIICWSVMQNNWVAVQGQDNNEGLFNQNTTVVYLVDV